ncbi:bifunctional protein-serine/threonine kinase/phosphatase [Pseudooceanicola sp. CBS1P-1]|uniref:Protein kinase n=1 Tax=Pseudooceanicola albus TaxID=2692189 RepID=A0A6L7G6J5_9RHOB|nr:MULTISPECIES: bifunctional protein-serine/threonine kinase/phosphatase [Pseudooceanicola]MBT9385572.1 bifunctional protein-serine/threonine kinase/phosphatase [Pseudooceanicola endophyticus]MXN19016.1 protein kinase [Pseudooceanicola albus]
MPRDTPQTSPARLTVSVGQGTDPGRKAENQDFLGLRLPDGPLLTLKGVVAAVADGISTSARGRMAAETTVRALLEDYPCTPDAWSVARSLEAVVQAGNAWLHAQTAGEELEQGAVCTLAALVLKGRQAHVLHLGDSRVSRLSGESIEPLTVDHQRRLSSGAVVLDRAMGLNPRAETGFQTLPLAVGDVFLLSTDGVHGHWDGPLVARALREAGDLQAAVDLILEAVKARGATDNLTLQILRIEALPDPDDATLFEEARQLPLPSALAPGAVLDGFQLLRLMHESHRSRIWLAQAPSGQRVTLKVPSAELHEDPLLLRQFLAEEWIARRVSSPHVLAAAPAPERRSALYLVGEYLEGQTLRQWMTDHPAPTLAQLRDIIGQLLKGLRALHRRQVLHQDLRPENIMIDAAGTVTIIDLGAARVAGLEEMRTPAPAPVLGTLQYSAPEYFLGDPAGSQADLFSLGVIAYEMLTGRLPYGARVARLRSRRDAARLVYRSARERAPGVPPWLDDALRRATHPDPARRFATLSEFDSALRAPGRAFRAAHPVPLAARNPVRFWQAVSALLALLVVVLLARLQQG